MPSTQILSRMQKLLTTMDQTGVSTIELSASRNVKATESKRVDSVPMWVRRSVARSVKVSSRHAYIAKFITVGLELITMINYQESRKLRKLQYILGSKALSHEDIKATIYDWAITLNIHPWAFGIIAQSKGSVTIPPRLNITCEVVDDVYKRDIEKKRLVGIETAILARILRLKVSMGSDFRLRAILVTEHQNLDFSSTILKAQLADVMIVQVGVVVFSI